MQGRSRRTDGRASHSCTFCRNEVLSHRATLAQVFQELPMEFAAEVNQLMSLKLEGSVG